MFNFVIKCQSLGISNQNNQLDTPMIICMIFSKLSVHIQDRSKRNKLKLIKMHSREPQMFDLANFVEDKMTIVSDPLYSGDAVSQYFEKNQKFINRRSLLSTLSRLRNYER